MRSRHVHHLLGAAALALLLATVSSCGSETPYDPENREIAWTYGPTTGTATPEHLKGTGTLGGSAIAKGWKCRLSDGRRLTVEPYHLSPSHTLFGKAVMVVGLFDRNGKQIGTVRSEAITAANATFSFDLGETAATSLYDVVIWFGEA